MRTMMAKAGERAHVRAITGREDGTKICQGRYPTTFQRYTDYPNIVLKAIQAKLFTPAMLPELARVDRSI